MGEEDRNNTNPSHRADDESDTSRDGTDERTPAAGQQGGSRGAQGVPQENSTRQSPPSRGK